MKTSLSLLLLAFILSLSCVVPRTLAAEPNANAKNDAEAKAFLEAVEKRREAQGLPQLDEYERHHLLVLSGFFSKEQLERRARLRPIRQLSLVLKAFANDDVAEQLFPQRLGELVDKEYVRDLKVFIDPANSEPPKLESGADVDAKSDYVYEGRGLRDDGDKTKIILFCKGHDGQGRTVGYADGHCEWIPEMDFRKLLAKQREAVKEGRMK